MKNNIIIPAVTYINIEEYKSSILKDNRGKSGIYRLNNTISGKSYVGSSVNIGNRLSIYYSNKAMFNKTRDRTSLIYSALLKHGYTNFNLDILEYCGVDILIKREQYYMDIIKPDYNILKAANSRIGSKHSLKTKALMSTKLSGINNPLFGKTHSYETRKKIGLSLKAIVRYNTIPKVVTVDTRLKLSLRSHGVRVKVFDLSNNLVKEFTTITGTAKHFGISNRTLSRYLNNNKPYRGYIFRSRIDIKS